MHRILPGISEFTTLMGVMVKMKRNILIVSSVVILSLSVGAWAGVGNCDLAVLDTYTQGTCTLNSDNLCSTMDPIYGCIACSSPSPTTGSCSNTLGASAACGPLPFTYYPTALVTQPPQACQQNILFVVTNTLVYPQACGPGPTSTTIAGFGASGGMCEE
jgi:hypothetical protein